MKKANIRGIIEEIIYENSFGWTVIKIRNGSKLDKVLGNIGKLKVGETWEFEGEWQYIPQYGSQFKVNNGFPIIPETNKEIIALLSGTQFPGIGIATATRLVNAYGDRLWEVLEKESERLETDGIITLKKARLITKALKALKNRWELLRFLVELNLPLRLLQPLGTLYLDKAIDCIKENPYRLLSFLEWTKTDTVALTLGINKDDKRRLEASVIQTLQKHLNRGHTFVFRKILIKESSSLINVLPKKIEAILKEPLVTFADEEKVQLTGIASLERTVADSIANLTNDPFPLVEGEWTDKWLKNYEKKNKIKLDFDQKLAVHESLKHRILVLTGGPGTGKTSVIKAIHSIFNEIGQKTILTAPTGRAAQRIQESTGELAKTLHRTFGYSQRRFDFEERDIELPTLIIDESSMVDLRMWNTIVTRINENTRLLIVGDPGQLPSIGPGQVLNDLIHSKVPVVGLRKIHRQAIDNPIPHISAAIRRGDKPKLKKWSNEKRGVFLISCPSEKKGAEQIVRLVVESLNREGFRFEDVQVLCPLKQGYCGTNNINGLIRQQLGRRNIGDKIPFAINDRVIQTINNYDLGMSGVMNGTTGMVVGQLESGVLVNFDDKLTEVKGNALADMDFAYSISIHKSQGSQYPVVVIPLYSTAGPLLNRQLIYTAITRATELAIIVGTEEVLYQAIDTHSLLLRNTAFSLYLKEALNKGSKNLSNLVSIQTRLDI